MSTSQTIVCVIDIYIVCIDIILNLSDTRSRQLGISSESLLKGIDMQLEGAIIKEQGQTFAVVAVKCHVTGSRHEASSAMHSFSKCFPRMPIVLMSQDARGVPTYFGRRDIANFLSRVPISAIPWKRYTFN